MGGRGEGSQPQTRGLGFEVSRGEKGDGENAGRDAAGQGKRGTGGVLEEERSCLQLAVVAAVLSLAFPLLRNEIIQRLYSGGFLSL